MTAPSSRLRQTVQWIGLAGGPVLAAALYAMLPERFAGADGELVPFTHAGRATMALMAWMATWWLTEAIDISTALLPIAFLPLAGAATIREATAPYGSDLIFLFMGGFILALSMQRWGLDRRIALITLRLVGSRPHNMVGGFMLATAMLSAFVSNTATTAMMLPVGLSVISLLATRGGAPGDVSQQHATSSNFAVCLMLGIAYAASIGGLATIIGSPPNVFLVGYIRDSIDPAFRQEISFVKWLAIGVPLSAVFLPLVWLLLTRVLYPIQIRHIEGGHDFIKDAHADLGPMKRGEWITFIVFLLTAALWITRPWLANVAIGGLRPFGGLTDAGIVITAAMLLFVMPVELRSRTFTMNWATASTLP